MKGKGSGGAGSDDLIIPYLLVVFTPAAGLLGTAPTLVWPLHSPDSGQHAAKTTQGQ
jgi:hypothetical protein